MKTSERIFEVFFVGVLTFFFVTIGVRAITKVVVDRLGVSNEFTKIVFFDAFQLDNGRQSREKIDWATVYPFDRKDRIVEEKRILEKPENFIVKISKRLVGYREYIEPYTTNYLIGKNIITELERRYEKIISYNYQSISENNNLVLTSDGYWIFVGDELNVAKQASSVARLSTFCRNLDVPLIYVNAPAKNCKYENFDISNTVDFTNKNADVLLGFLNDFGVDNYDLREAVHKENRSHHKMFFVTDHHWLPESGLWAARYISEVLNYKYDGLIDISLFEENRFSKKVYRQWFLGSQGKRVTLANAKPEDFRLLYPKYSTRFHYEIKNKRINLEGDFSMLYNMDLFKNRNLYGPSVYDAYIHGDQPLEKIENELSKNDMHVLIVHDSFGDVVVPFLALGVRRVDSIDSRYFNGSLRTYIEKERPDVVVVLLQSASMYDERRYNFE